MGGREWELGGRSSVRVASFYTLNPPPTENKKNPTATRRGHRLAQPILTRQNKDEFVYLSRSTLPSAS